jgi:chemotaxis regulatin CheY-phosphate phosphatase CheZ
MRLEKEVRRRYAAWARELATALDAGDETRAEALLVHLGRAGAWSLRHAVDRYARAATEAITHFSSALMLIQQTRPTSATNPPREMDALVLLAEDAVHRTLDAVERAFAELDYLRDTKALDAKELERGLDRTRLALRDVLATQGFQDQLGQLLGRCVSLVDTLAAQLDVLLHFLGEPRDPGSELLSRLAASQGALVTQQQIDALLDQRNASSHGG